MVNGTIRSRRVRAVGRGSRGTRRRAGELNSQRARAIGAALSLVATVAAATATAVPAGAAGYEIIRTVAGNGEEASTGDGGPATEASLAGPADVVADSAGNFYVAELFGSRVRKVDTSGVITAFAGTGEYGYNGDGIPATQAHLNATQGLAVDGSGNVYIADTENQRIRKVDTSGIITTVAGTGEFGYNSDDIPATEAMLAGPYGVSLDSDGNLYIADTNNGRVRKVDTSGIITTVAGDGNPWELGEDGIPATESHVRWPVDVDVDSAGNVFIAEDGRVRKVDATTQFITTVAGNGDGYADFNGDGIPATDASVDPQGVSVDAAGNLYIADASHNRVRRVDPSGIISTAAGGGRPEDGLGDGGPPTQARLNNPLGLDVDETLGLLIADLFNNRIRQVVAVPDLMLVVKSDAPDPLNIDQNLTYTIQVTNNSAGPATGVTLTDTLPASVSFGSATATQGTCTESGGTVTCALGEMAAGASAIATIAVTPTTPGLITNTASVRANEADPFPGNNSATEQTAVGDRGCGQVITRTTRLSEDIGPCPANGIIIGADKISLDLGGHRVFGFPGPGDGNSGGIRLPARSRVRVHNGTVSDFDAGVVLNGGRANTVTKLTVRDNVGPDDAFSAELGDGIILFDSADNRIFHNVVTGNGIFDGIGVLGGTADGNVIHNNTLDGNVGPSDEGPAGQGIIVNAAGLGVNDGAVIEGTIVKGNVVRGSGSAGIANINNIGAQILNNVVEGNGLTNGAGNGIGMQLGPRSEMPFTRALVQGNEVHGNGADGIHVQRGATENRIIDNDAADNNARALPWLRGFDLHDLNRDPETFQPDCDSNVWSGNVWGSAYYSPACTAAGGSGPPLPPPEPEGPYGEPTCFDAWDNDQDGLTDGEDPDCWGGSVAQTPPAAAVSSTAAASPEAAQLPPTRRAPSLGQG